MNHLTLKWIKVVLTLFLMSVISAYGQNPVLKDIYGREILNTKGEKINYPKSDLTPMGMSLKNAKLLSKSNSNVSKDTIAIQTENLYSVMGTSIGRNSMHILDIDNDGVNEIICTASTQTFGSANFWYIMHYNANDSTCNQIWTSPQYENNITTLEVVDFNDDMNYKILLGFNNGTIQVYDAKTKELINEVKPVNEKINSIVYADADNDSQKDIVISCENSTCVLNSNTLAQKFKINKGANYVRVGDIDGDAINEIVLSSGTVYQLKDSALTTEWNFSTSGEGYIELSDIDNDSKKEIIYAQSWNYIYVYDADTKTTKYSIKTDQDINTLLLRDVNNDGIDEILYGDGQWGKINCYNSVTQVKMWSVNNPEHGVTAIDCTDLNNDGKQELIWGAGWTSTGSDYLYIYNLSENKLLWRSSDIVGPFYAIATGDVDGDGKPDIVAVSYESESGYGSGVILIIDAQTKKLKWKSSGDFLYSVWTGIYNLSIKDIDNDGNNEIIIAAGQTYTGEIWIIDGKNHTIKSSHIFSTENISEFYSMAIEDIDNDGIFELIAANSSKLYVINPNNWSVKWDVNLSSYYSKPVVKCADIDGDGKKEIIVCKGTIQIVNSSDHSIWNSSESNYLNIDTFDFNKDGVVDIVASTSSGHILVIDGKTKSKLSDINPETHEVSSVRLLNFNNSNLYIYSCDGRINYYLNESNCIVSQYFGNKIGEVEALKLFSNADTTALLVGTPISVLKIPGKSFICTGLNILIDKAETSCDKNDGKIFLNVTGGSTPYKFIWNDNSGLDSITNLKAGNYFVKVQDNGGCIKTRNINIPSAYITANIQVTDEGCKNKGSAHINIDHINAPYTINWSNSQTGIDNLNLGAGNYTVIINDSKNCKYENVAKVNKDTVIMSVNIRNITCYDHNTGSIQLSRISGTEPLNFKWLSGETTSNLNFLKAGRYNVTITDAVECKTDLNLSITQPDKIAYDILVSPDNSDAPNWEGKTIIDNITGGISPYEIYWPKFSKYSDYLDVLPAGKYAFVITDANDCQISDTATIGTMTTGIEDIFAEMFQVYPNPAKDELLINLKFKEIPYFKFELVNTNGQIVKSKFCDNNEIVRIDLTDLKSGLYIMKISANHSVYFGKIIKCK